MKLILLVAYGQNMVIGNKGGLPSWKLPADMENFKRVTLEKRGMIMGRKTYESFRRPSGELKPLPGRDSFIVTRNESYEPEGRNERVFVCNSLTNAIGDAFALGYNEICVIGGGEIYWEALRTNFEIEIWATEVDGEFEGDTFFPTIDYSLWNKEVLLNITKDEKNSHSFQIVGYTKK